MHFLSATGIISNHAKKDLYCLVCTSANDMSDCARGDVERQVCPPHFNYCKSTVQYYFAETKDVRYNGNFLCYLGYILFEGE